MPSPFDLAVKGTTTAFNNLTTELASLSKRGKSRIGNYDFACQMYYTSVDTIAELKKQVAKGKDPKAGIDLKKWEANHPALGATVKSTCAELDVQREGLGQAKKVVATIEQALEKLNKVAARTATIDVEETVEELDELANKLTRASKDIKDMEKLLAHLPKPPKV